MSVKTLRKKVTIVDIAEHLGISKTTVSFVLSGQAEKRRIAEKTAHRVKQVAKDLGYVPNHWARSMRTQRTCTICVLFRALEWNWAGRMMDGIIEVLSEKDYTPYMGLHDRMPKLKNGIGGIERREILSIIERCDEAVICAAIPDARNDYMALLSNNIPLVFIGDELEDMTALEGVSSVTWNSGPAAETAVRHLVETGKRRIGFAGAHHGVVSDIARYRAYEKVLKEVSLPIKKEWVLWGTPPWSPGPEQLKPIFSNKGEKPDAFFAINDAVATGLLHQLHCMNVRVPQDVAIVGMGNLATSICSGINADLTTIHEPIEEIGQTAAKMVLDLINDPHQNPIHRKITCNDLKIRRTTVSA